MQAKKHFPSYCYVLTALLVLVIVIASSHSVGRGAILPVTLRALIFLLIACSLGILLPGNFETLTRLFLCLGLTGTLISVQTLISVVFLKLELGLLGFSIWKANYMYGLPQVTSFFKNPNGLGLFLVFSIASLLVMFTLLKEEGKKKRSLAVLFYAAPAVQLLTLVLTFSRAAFIALSLFVLCFVWFNRRRHCYIPPLALLGAALFTSKQALCQSGLAEIISALFSGRIQLWAEGFRLFIRHPLFGTGLGSWFALTGNNMPVHNTYLHIAVEIGLTGLIVYLAYIALFMRSLKRAMNRAVLNTQRYALLSSIYSLSVGLLVHQFFESYLYQGLPLFLMAIIPLHTLLREPGTLYHLPEPLWREQGVSWFYRRAS